MSTTPDDRPALAADSERIAHAYELAREAHAGQTRKDGSPYIGHPLSVARTLEESGADEAMIAAALLHDVVEDTELEIGDVVERFGADVGELVAALTEDRSIADYEERKSAHRDEVEAAGPRAVSIYVADKLSNLGDMRRIYADRGEAAEKEFNAPIDTRVRLWRGDAEMAQRVVPELASLEAFHRGLAAFERERAGRGEKAGATGRGLN